MNLAAARKEVSAKSARQIERETAAKWAARAVACHEKFATGVAMKDGVCWQARAEDYEQEALEHAALVRDGGRTVAKIEKALHKARKRLR